MPDITVSGLNEVRRCGELLILVAEHQHTMMNNEPGHFWGCLIFHEFF